MDLKVKLNFLSLIIKYFGSCFEITLHPLHWSIAGEREREREREISPKG